MTECSQRVQFYENQISHHEMVKARLAAEFERADKSERDSIRRKIDIVNVYIAGTHHMLQEAKTIQFYFRGRSISDIKKFAMLTINIIIGGYYREYLSSDVVNNIYNKIVTCNIFKTVKLYNQMQTMHVDLFNNIALKGRIYMTYIQIIVLIILAGGVDQDGDVRFACVNLKNLDIGPMSIDRVKMTVHRLLMTTTAQHRTKFIELYKKILLNPNQSKDIDTMATECHHVVIGLSPKKARVIEHLKRSVPISMDLVSNMAVIVVGINGPINDGVIDFINTKIPPSIKISYRDLEKTVHTAILFNCSYLPSPIHGYCQKVDRLPDTIVAILSNR